MSPRTFLLLVGCVCFVWATPEENRGSTRSNLREGDIVVSGPRGAESARWPQGMVHYTIDQSLANNEIAVKAITDAMLMWSTKTCVKFTKRTNEQSYLQFYLGGECSSALGHQGYKQFVSLGPHCWQAGVVAHVLGHALGLQHEQSRPDRDSYVTINWENIVEDDKPKFTRNNMDTFGLAYDYQSLMHFEEKAFSKNGQPTVVPKSAGVKIGQREKPSQLDVQRISQMYKCGAVGGIPGTGGGSGGSGGECFDGHQYCKYWTGQGYCQTNTAYMRLYCKQSCNFCSGQPNGANCHDYNNQCQYWAARNECSRNPNYMRTYCKKSCKAC